MKYCTEARFAGQPLTIGRTVLVCWMVRARGDVAEYALYPAVAEALAYGDVISFRLSDGRLVSSTELDAYNIVAQEQPPHGFVATTVETVTRLQGRAWTWAPIVR